MAPPTDPLLHYTGDRALSLAVVLLNGVVLSAAVLLYCTFWKRKTVDLRSGDTDIGKPNSELRRVTEIPESQIQEKNKTNNGVIPAGAEKSQKSQKTKSEAAGRNGKSESPAPGRNRKSESPAPGRNEKSEAPAPGRNGKSESPAPGRNGKSESPAPGRNGKSEALAPGRNGKSEALAPGRNGKNEAPALGRNGKSVDQVSLYFKNRALPLPPQGAQPASGDDPLYESVKDRQHPAQPADHHTDPEPDEEPLGETSGDLSTSAGLDGGGGNPELLENINPLYHSVEKKTTPTDQMTDLTNPESNPRVEMESYNPERKEPIYSVICRDKRSVKAPSGQTQEKTPSQDSGVEMEDSPIPPIPETTIDSRTSPTNPPSETSSDSEVLTSNSFKLNQMIRRCRDRSFKTSSPGSSDSMNNDLEEPPPVPDRLFEIENEV